MRDKGASRHEPTVYDRSTSARSGGADDHAALLRTHGPGTPNISGAEQYRLYASHTLQIIRFIRAAQAAGFSLADVRSLLILYSGNLALCKDVQPLIAKRLSEVSQRLEELRHIQCLLQSFLNQCRAQDQDTLCHVVDALSGAASSCISTSP